MSTSRVTTVDIIDEINALRQRDYPALRSQSEAMSIERLAPEALAVLALVGQWSGVDLDRKLGPKTIKESIMDAADLKTPKGLTQILNDLAQAGLVRVRYESRLFSSTVRVDWSSEGQERCYAYLNQWGWEKLSKALELHRHIVDGGPPLVGGPGRGGWSSKDI